MEVPTPDTSLLPSFFPMIWHPELYKSLGQPHGACYPPAIFGSLCEQRLTALLRARRVAQLLWAPSQCSSENTSCPTASSFTFLIHSALLRVHLFCALGRGSHACGHLQAMWASAPCPVRRSHTSVWGGGKETKSHLSTSLTSLLESHQIRGHHHDHNIQGLVWEETTNLRL